jgi:hypothetical protein
VEKRHKEEGIFTFCVSVGPVDYSQRINKFPTFRNGKSVLPEKGNDRAKFCMDFAIEVIKEKFLNEK